MINRLQLLRNVGRFDSVSAGANLPFARLTLIYAENGRGKTTLSAILRSLASGDPIPVTERRRLNAPNRPHVIVDCGGEPHPAIFENGRWNRTLPGIAVYDDVFVDANVYSGLAVDPEHRQNLHELILGAEGVALNGQLQDLVAQIEEHNGELRIKGSLIPAADRGALSVDDFCALEERPDIDAEMQATEHSLAAARDQDAVRARPGFAPLSLPAFDLPAIDRVLQRDLPTVDGFAIARVHAHFAALGHGGEAWVADGMQRMPPAPADNSVPTCPFCAQGLSGSPVIDQYRAYFSEAYVDLGNDVSEALDAIARTHGGDAPMTFERGVRAVADGCRFWARFCDTPEADLDPEQVTLDWRVAREAMAAVLGAKQAAPLERMTLTDEVRDAVAAYEAHRQTVAALDKRLQEANVVIGATKERAETGDARALASDLARLAAIRARYVPAAATLCDEYLSEKAAKARAEQLRDATRVALDRHRTNVFPAYQAATNAYLERFNAGFRLERVTPVNIRGGSTCTYSVVINETPVAVAGGVPVPGEPSFRNILSAGDRNTLALAFFLASLDADPTLVDRIVVIDDPVSSLDDNRSLVTEQEIRHLAARCAQVIVLSHHKPVLCRIWEGADRTQRAAMEVIRDPTGSTVRAWDVSRDAITDHDRRHAKLREYLATGGPNDREVAEGIRPLLEAFLRVACPLDFQPGTHLGTFLGLCNDGLGTARQILDEVTTRELHDLVEYANRFHHDTNPSWQTETINGGELEGFVQRALAFASR